MRKLIYTLASISILLISNNVLGQKKTEATLFTFGGQPVSKSEFLRMYTKNINNQKPDFSEKAVREYLSLYGRFKMKVAEAEKLQMDTLPSIQSDLGSYKKQLAKTYLTDKQVTDRLVKEAHTRMLKDVHVAHIMLAVKNGTDDTMSANRKADSLYRELTNNKADFAKLAQTFSDDKQSGVNGGDIGFMNALQIPYPFENAAYNTPIGGISKPFRTIYGYHIVKKIEDRPARGEVQVAQILIPIQKSAGSGGEKAAKARVDSVVTQLKKGAKFEAMVDKYSEDKFSKNSEGALASFGVGQMDPAFENASFSLKKIGEISEPILTNYGYHIIKLLRKMPVKPFDSMKNELSKKVEKDGRIDIAREEYTNKIKQKVNYKDNMVAVNQLIDAIPDSVMTNGTYKADNYKKYITPIFTMTGVTFTQNDFANYIETFTHGRIYGQKESTLRSLFKNYSDKVLYDFQENKLADENEDYRNLLTEYRDGIMLFELTDKTVWSKASIDSIGLEKYFEQNKSKYQWAPSITADLYRAKDEDVAKLVVKELNNPKNETFEDIIKNINGDDGQTKVVTESGKFEKTKFPATMKFIAGKYAPYYKNEDGSFAIVNVKEVFDTPTQKTLNEARGYVISEYQEYLEKQWNSSLENKYPMVVNDAVLKSIIK